MDTRISMWGYEAYQLPETLEEAVREASEAGYGVEVWPSWKSEDRLFAPENRERLRNLLLGVPSSLHSSVSGGLREYKEQIDAAAETESDVLVVHPDQLRVAGEPDFAFAREVVAYATDRRVMIALENGDLRHLLRALVEVPDLFICLDVGHVYVYAEQGGQNRPMQEFVDALKWHIRHLHLQDLYLRPGTFHAQQDSHRTPGCCDIPPDDYAYLLAAMDEVGFAGAAVLEVRPFTQVEIAGQSRHFLESIAPPAEP